MTTNLREREHIADRPDETSVVEPIPTANPTLGVTPARVNGVQVYDTPENRPVDPARRPAMTPVASDVPGEPNSTGSVFAWIVGAIVVILVAYFIWQLIF